MKNLLLTTMIVGASLFSNETKAQLGFSLHVNIGNRPSWGVPGNVNANYYYMPEIDAYYDLSSRQFIYEDKGRWIFAASLPSYYRDYNLNTGYKVIVNEPRPYLRGDFYRQQYRAHYNAFRRNDVYAQRNSNGYRNDNRFDNRYDNRNNGYDQRGNNNDRFDRGRNDDRRNDQRSNDRFDQGRQQDQRNDRMDNRNEQKPSAPAMNNAPNQQGNDDHRGNRNGVEQNRNEDANRSNVPGQVRTAQRRG